MKYHGLCRIYVLYLSVHWSFVTVAVSFGTITSTFMSYSVFLMQEHNSSEYIKFLEIINKYKLYWFCGCCVKSLIIDGLKWDEYELDITIQKNENVLDIDSMDTYNASQNDDNITSTKQNEDSVQTVNVAAK